jgi:hypothetical protein
MATGHRVDTLLILAVQRSWAIRNDSAGQVAPEAAVLDGPATATVIDRVARNRSSAHGRHKMIFLIAYQQ